MGVHVKSHSHAAIRTVCVVVFILLALMLAVLLPSSPARASDWTVTKIQGSAQLGIYEPRIDGDNIIYLAYDGNAYNFPFKLYLYNVATGGQPRLLSENAYTDIGDTPAIDGNYVAWTGGPNGGDWGTGADNDVYLHDIAANTTTVLTSAGYDYDVCLQGDWLVWVGKSGSGGDEDIFAYRISTAGPVIHFGGDDGLSGTWGYDDDPAVYGGRVVWHYDPPYPATDQILTSDLMSNPLQSTQLAGDQASYPLVWDRFVSFLRPDGTGGWNLFVRDLNETEAGQVAGATANQNYMDFDGGVIAWINFAAGGGIRTYDPVAKETRQLAGQATAQSSPRTDGDGVVWTAVGTQGIAHNDLGTGVTEFFATPTGATRPDVDGDRVVWQGDATGNKYRGLYLAARGGAASGFPDVPSMHPYYAAISGMAAQQIIGGYANGNFGPEDLVIRQQFAKMIVLTLGLPVDEDDYPNAAVPFVDLGADDAAKLYPHEYVAVCALNNITKGKDPTHFAPFLNITRQQVITMVVRAADNLATGALQAVPDGWNQGVLNYSDPTHGANVKKAEYNGLLAGIRANLSASGLAGWNTGANATRGEVAQVLWNLLQKLP